MMQTIKIVLLILVSMILQIALLSRVSVFGSRLDLPLALVVSMGLYRGSFHGEVVGFTSGLFCDLFSDGPIMGIQAFSRTLIGYGIGFIRGRLYSDNFITQLVSGFIATIAHKFITLTHLGLLFGDMQFVRIRFSGLIFVAILNAILVAFVYSVLKRAIRSES